MRYLDPKNDLTFKKVFGTKPHLLKSFLNALLPLPEGEQVEKIEYLPAELVPEIPGLKNTIVDVRCTDNKGRQFIVEMQMLWTNTFKYRVLFNASKAYVRQIGKGIEYKGLQPVYALSLVNEVFEPEMPGKFYHHYAIVHTDMPNKRLEGLEFVFVELPKFKPNSISEKQLAILWLRFLTEIKDGTETIPDEFFKNDLIKEAVEILQESSLTRNELETYDKYWDIIRTERAMKADSEEKGLKEGMEKGKNLGIQMTIQVLKFFNEGKPLSEIARKLNLPEETVKLILEESGTMGN